MKVVLDEAERKLAQYLAKRRYAVNREGGVADKKVGPQSSEFTDLNGIGAEIAFCRMMNIYPDLSIGPRSGGWDCVTAKGRTVDVKATKYKNGKLLAMIDKEGWSAEAYVLMVGEFPEYEWVGWASAEKLLREENITDLGYGPTYALDQEALEEPII